MRLLNPFLASSPLPRRPVSQPGACPSRSRHCRRSQGLGTRSEIEHGLYLQIYGVTVDTFTPQTPNPRVPEARQGKSVCLSCAPPWGSPGASPRSPPLHLRPQPGCRPASGGLQRAPRSGPATGVLAASSASPEVPHHRLEPGLRRHAHARRAQPPGGGRARCRPGGQGWPQRCAHLGPRVPGLPWKTAGFVPSGHSKDSFVARRMLVPKPG